MRRAVLISGRGSNLANLFAEQDEFPVSLIVSNVDSALGIGRARRQGIPVLVDKGLNKKNSPSWQRLAQFLNERKFGQVLLLGFMRILPPEFIRLFNGETINLHPSLLPSYRGLEAIEKSYADQSPMGVSVHHVIEELDAGPIILQRQLKIPKQSGKYSVSLQKAQFLISLLEQRTVLAALRQRPDRRLSGI